MATVAKLNKAKKGKGRRAKSRFAKVNWDKAAQLFQRPPAQEKGRGDYPTTREILHFLTAAGAVGLVLAFPPAITGVAALVKLGKRNYSPWGVKRLLNRLAKQKYVTVKEGPDGQITVTITKDGMARALTYQLDNLTLSIPKKWDQKWRVVIFDVPEKHRDLRDIFRMRLRQMGLYKLQESVYVSPYPCFDEVEFLRELYGIAFTVRYLLVEKIEDDSFLRDRFNLS